MVDPIPLKLAVSEDSVRCAEFLEDLAKRCRQGEWIAFAGCLFGPGGRYTTVGHNSRSVDPIQIIGALFVTAMSTDQNAREAAVE